MNTCLCEAPITTVEEDWIRVVVDEELEPLPCRKNGLELRHGEEVVVETADGPFLGHVTLMNPPVMRQPKCRSGRILRQATDDDLRAREAARFDEREIARQMQRLARNLKLELKLQKVRVPLSGRKAVVYFSSEQRVDFRRLVRDLGRDSGRRIEMRPMGVRDGAKVVGALGPCGRCLCCVSFMNRFHSVTVRMAKRQNLSLNPAKISGMCGRLMCCLAHEVDNYPAGQGGRRK